MSMWGGRFKKEANEIFFAFNRSFTFDRRLFKADIKSGICWAEVLTEAGILKKEESTKIKEGLLEIKKKGEDPSYFTKSKAEDIHSFIEEELVKLIGDLGYNLNAGRSRNDQVATDMRLYLKEEVSLLEDYLLALLDTIIEKAKDYIDCPISGYTHLQRAQPILFSHLMLAYFEMFWRDVERFFLVIKNIDHLPLGCGALAGTSFAVDREKLAGKLGFSRVCLNSIDAVSDRDFLLDFLYASAVLMMHLSRMSEDFIIYSSSEFGFIELSDKISSGSSLMPQKKNPDAFELLRGKTGRVYGALMSLLTVMKGLPLSYDKDLQEDKEGVFDAVDTVKQSLKMAVILLANISLNKEKSRQAASESFTNSTDLADYLVLKGMPFRKAHQLVGQIVLFCIEKGFTLETLPLEDYKKFSPLFENDIFEKIYLEAVVTSKKQIGGTSLSAVKKAIAKAETRTNLKR